MDIQREVVDNYQLKALNSAFTKRMFTTYYDVYKQVITEFQSQTKQQQQQTPANNNTDKTPPDTAFETPVEGAEGKGEATNGNPK